MKKQFLIFVMLCVAMMVSAQEASSRGAGVFSVSDSTVVELAPSNLQYQPSTGTYRLAEHTLDIIGEANGSFDDSTYVGWLDLLVWGDYTFADWRMPSVGEWRYLLNYRRDAHLLVGLATVDGRQGLALLPDAWQQPEGLSFVSCDAAGFALSLSTLLYADMSTTDHYTDNIYTSEEWQRMADAGAAFLPATGERVDSNVCCIGQAASYWSSSVEYPGEAYRLSAIEWNIATNAALTDQGMAVRLVRDADVPAAIADAKPAPRAMKVLKNDRVLLIVDGCTYDVLGRRLR